MKENFELGYKSEIKWPELGKVEVGINVDFAYIIRKDGNFTMKPIAESLSSDYNLDSVRTQQILLEEYDIFFAQLVDAFKWGYSSKGNFEVHLFSSSELDEAIRSKFKGDLLVSLDPLMNQGVHEFKVSRGYYLSGKKDFGQIPRPGSEPLSLQAQNIQLSSTGAVVRVVEDDVFSGGSLSTALDTLSRHGIPLEGVLVGIQVGKPNKVMDMGIPVTPVVSYETTNEADIFDKVDLGDPRDYLLGASGLVVKLPNGEYGRCPYILPYVSTTARASIPQEVERDFAVKVLQANYEFFDRTGEKLGKPITLSQMNPDFLATMHTLFGFDKNTPMNQVVSWSMNNLDEIWDSIQKVGELQAKEGEQI